MPLFPLRWNVIMICSLLAPACMKGPDTQKCMLTVGGQITTADGMLSYYITSSKRAFIQSLTYQGLQGPVTIDTPQLPYAVSFPVSKGLPVSLSAEGTIIEGYLVAGYDFIAQNERISHSDTCSK
jgi:hypothetical protein